MGTFCSSMDGAPRNAQAFIGADEQEETAETSRGVDEYSPAAFLRPERADRESNERLLSERFACEASELAPKRLVQILRDSDDACLQAAAAGLLVAAVESNLDAQRLMAAGAIPVLVKRLGEGNADDVRVNATWALANIAGADLINTRNAVLRENAVSALVAQIEQQEPSLALLRMTTWALHKLCSGPPPPPFDSVRPALGKLAELVYHDEEEIVSDACWALAFMCDGPSANIQAVIDSGAHVRCIELLMHPSYAIRMPALRTVGNIATGDDMHTQVIVGEGALEPLLVLLSSDHAGLRRESCWTISNIMAGTRAQIQAVLDANIVPRLIEVLDSESEEPMNIKYEATWAIVNAASGGSPEQVMVLVELGCARALRNLLELDPEKEANMLTIALTGLLDMSRAAQKQGRTVELLRNVDERGGSLDKLGVLAACDKPKVAAMAERLLDVFAEETDDELQG